MASRRAQVVGSEAVGERIDAEPGELGDLDVDVVGIEHDHLAERARVDEPQLLGRLAGQRQHDVGVGKRRRPPRDEQELAAHPQVHHQRVAGVERAEQVLAAPAGGEDRRAGEAVDQLAGRRAPDRPFAADVDGEDLPADDPLLEPSADGLDLRQLRHQRVVGLAESRSSPAASAAACSAAFFERPVPSPAIRPSITTVAKNRLA